MSEKPKVLVTGCSRGLGKFMVQALHDANYYVIGISRSSYDELDEKLKKSLSEYLSLDLSDISAVSAFIGKLPALKAIFLNASHRSFNRFDLFSLKEVNDSINSSFTHQLLILHSVIQKMLSHNGGTVVFITSKAAFKGYSKGSLYCSVKAAWLSIFESLSRDYRSKNVNFINFIPDSFSDNKGNDFSFKTKIEFKMKNIIDNFASQHSNKEVKVFTMKTRLFLIINRIKSLISI